MDYKNGKIYKLVAGDLTYYGSTCSTLSSRLHGHKWGFKAGSNTTSRKLFETGEEVKIYLVEYFPCENKMELNARERWWIENNECVNKMVPTRTQKEYKKVHKERIAEQRKEWYEANKERKAEYNKVYREANKERIAERAKAKYRATKKAAE